MKIQTNKFFSHLYVHINVKICFWQMFISQREFNAHWVVCQFSSHTHQFLQCVYYLQPSNTIRCVCVCSSPTELWAGFQLIFSSFLFAYIPKKKTTTKIWMCVYKKKRIVQISVLKNGTITCSFFQLVSHFCSFVRKLLFMLRANFFYINLHKYQHRFFVSSSLAKIKSIKWNYHSFVLGITTLELSSCMLYDIYIFCSSISHIYLTLWAKCHYPPFSRIA